MIHEEDYTLHYLYLERTEQGIKHYHFELEGPNFGGFYFYTYADTSAFIASNLNKPLDYITFGTLLLIYRDEIREAVIKHQKDEVSGMLDHYARSGKPEKGKEVKGRR